MYEITNNYKEKIETEDLKKLDDKEKVKIQIC